MCYDVLNIFSKSSLQCNTKYSEPQSIRVFAISPLNPIISTNGMLYKIQKKRSSDTCKITLKQLHEYIQKNYSMSMIDRMLIEKNNIQISKLIQNLYVTSFGGINLRSIKILRVQLLINATIDLPNIDDDKLEILRVPMNIHNPDDIEPYLEDVVDKIQAISIKNMSTIVYCYDGMVNSLTLVTFYFIKYTDLMLYEIIQHLVFSRRGYQIDNCFGCYRDMVFRYAKKYKKIFINSDEQLSNPQISGQFE